MFYWWPSPHEPDRSLFFWWMSWFDGNLRPIVSSRNAIHEEICMTVPKAHSLSEPTHFPRIHTRTNVGTGARSFLGDEHHWRQMLWTAVGMSNDFNLIIYWTDMEAYIFRCLAAQAVRGFAAQNVSNVTFIKILLALAKFSCVRGFNHAYSLQWVCASFITKTIYFAMNGDKSCATHWKFHPCEIHSKVAIIRKEDAPKKTTFDKHLGPMCIPHTAK